MRIVAFIISFVLFIASLYVFSLAFALPGFELPVFFGGIVLIVIAFAIPLHLLKRTAP